MFICTNLEEITMIFRENSIVTRIKNKARGIERKLAITNKYNIKLFILPLPCCPTRLFLEATRRTFGLSIIAVHENMSWVH